MAKRMTATFVKKMEKWRADGRLYRMSPPYRGEKYVIASAAVLHDDPEVYLFAADESGDTKTMLEMPGSQKGTTSHHDVLGDLGYTVLGDDDRGMRENRPMNLDQEAFVSFADSFTSAFGYQPGDGYERKD
jgi:hypothetical protein